MPATTESGPEVSPACSQLVTAARLRAWQQLLRAGNAFTAMSNIVAGACLVGSREQVSVASAAVLVAASVCLYSAGMVLNDAFDADVDALERPRRPIPSGRVTRRAAWRAGWLLLAAGIVLASVVSIFTANIAPGLIAACLGLVVVMYNGGLKGGAAGPWAMGWCRSLNVVLGGSLAIQLSDHPILWKHAAAVGFYTVGISYLARDEATAGPSNAFAPVRFASVAAFMGAILLTWSMTNADSFAVPRYAWGTLEMIAFAAVGVSWAFAARGGEVRIRAVVRLLRGFIVLDALAVLAALGWAAAAGVAGLLVPAVVASRRAPMT